MPGTQKIKILIVEDHTSLAANLFEFFATSRYVLDLAPDGLTALHLIASGQYDVIILDIMLPGLSGFEICKRVRNDLHCLTPIIMMTSKDQLQDKEQGFTAGADDYLVKPFHLRELQLRVDALARRKNISSVQASLRIPGMLFDLGTLIASNQEGKQLELSGTNARLLEELLKAYPNILSHSDIQERIWGDKEVDMNTLRTHVYGLRKLLQDTFSHPMIKTVHGRGYRISPPENTR